MFSRELLGLFPRKRIRAMDGMAVTAEVWEEAHDYHRMVDRLHTLLHHGSGIVGGLEVIASDPADSSVYVLPGLAVDPVGQSIVVPEPRAYDMGSADGMLYLVLAYNESRPQSGNGRVNSGEPLYIYNQYTLEALSALPPTPHVELARIWRRSSAGPITAAKEPNHPRLNEIDQRYRRQIGHYPQDPVSVGVVTLRGAEGTHHGEGMANVAAAMRLNGGSVWVDLGIPLGSGLDRYDLLYVVGRDMVQFSNEEMNALYQYWQQGGVIFYESCRRNQESGDPAADARFLDLLTSFGVQLRPVELGHELLKAPYLFGAAPDGFETRGAPTLRAGERSIVSTFDYGCIWRGERRGRPAARSEIRNALEWGANLVTWAAARRAEARQAQTGRA